MEKLTDVNGIPYEVGQKIKIVAGKDHGGMKEFTVIKKDWSAKAQDELIADAGFVKVKLSHSTNAKDFEIIK